MSDGHDHSTNGTREPMTPEEQAAELISVYGLCYRRSRLAKRDMPHDWHPAGMPINTPVSVVMTRTCCYCAPDGVQIVVRWTATDAEVEAERLKHGRRLIIEQVKPQPGGGILLPGQ